MTKSSPSVLLRAAVVAMTFTIAAIVLSLLPLGPFHSLLTSRPSSLQLPRILTILSFSVAISWALRGTYRPAQRIAIVTLGSLVLSDCAVLAAYMFAQLH